MYTGGSSPTEVDPMQLQQQFSRQQLLRILDQSLVYECACPAQVCRQMLALAELFQYQKNCADRDDTDTRVHQVIAEATRESYAAMESCLGEVLDMEGWDRDTLTLPGGLRNLQ
ncbi:MAG: hypothetical protein PsegKO_26910 [Pseudohongiellaceae bacterium]|jgi:hypothetical protein